MSQTTIFRNNLSPPILKISSRFRINVFSIAVLLGLGLLVYSHTCRYPFEFDDYSNIVANTTIRNLANLKAIWSFWPTRFVTYLSLALNYHFGKLDVFGYHVFNIIIHLSAALLVRWFILLIFSTPVIKKSALNDDAYFISFFASIIFVCHPIQTQAVTYIIQRASSLAAFFYMASLCFYLKSRILQFKGESDAVWTIYYIGSLVSGIFSMFTKEFAITLPFAIFLCEHCFFKDKKPIELKYAAAFMVMFLVIPFTMLITRSIALPGMHLVWDKPLGISPFRYLLTQFRAIITYLRLFVMPFNQSIIYDYPLAEGLFQPRIILSLFFLSALFYIAKRLFLKYRIISFSIFWFFLTILPESSIIPIKDVIFEHRMYLPMVGFCLFLSSALYYLLGRQSRLPAIMMLSCLIFMYAGLAYARNLVWRDELVLWDDAVTASSKATAYEYRGTVFLIRGFYDKAISDYTKAMQKEPDYSNLYNKRGVAYYKKGLYEQAILDYDKAIKLDPDYIEAYYNRAALYFSKGDFKMAFSDYDKAIEMAPSRAEGYYNRGLAYFFKKDYHRSYSDMRKAQLFGYKIAPAIMEKLLK